MKTIVFFNSPCKSSNCFCMSLLIKGSSAEKASSINNMSVSVASALAKPTLCCIPPDSWFGYWFSKPLKPTASIFSIATLFLSSGFLP